MSSYLNTYFGENDCAPNLIQWLNFCSHSWITILKTVLKSTFKDVNKGWFYLKETNIDAYNFSKMKKFLKMIQFMMQDSLRFLTEGILHKYTRFIEKHCGAPNITIKSINDVACEFSKSDYTSVRNCEYTDGLGPEWNHGSTI